MACYRFLSVYLPIYIFGAGTKVGVRVRARIKAGTGKNSWKKNVKKLLFLVKPLGRLLASSSSTRFIKEF